MMKTIVDHLRAFWNSLADFLFPRVCVTCGARLSTGKRFVCTCCEQDMPLVRYPSFEDNPMAQRFWAFPAFVRAFSFFFYQRGSYKTRILYEFKYHHNPQLAVYMGRLLAQSPTFQGFFNDIDCLIPVPLSVERQKERGYNQSERLAAGISQITGIPVENNVVVRVTDNPSQTHLTAMERCDNVRSIFALTPHADALRGKHILLIDDVFTTGATLVELSAVCVQIPEIRFSVVTLALASYTFYSQ